MAMVLAVGATAAHPRLALELAVELAGSRGAETVTPADAVANLVAAFEAGLRKTLARMGISAVASYIGGSLIDTVDLAPDVVARCFPMAAAWPGRTTLRDLGARALRRREAALALPVPPPGREARLPDPGWARFRADGEAHLFSPSIAKEIQVLSGSLVTDGDAAAARRPDHRRPARPLPGRARAPVRCPVRAARRAAHPARPVAARRSTTSRTPGPSRAGSSSRR